MNTRKTNVMLLLQEHGIHQVVASILMDNYDDFNDELSAREIANILIIEWNEANARLPSK